MLRAWGAVFLVSMACLAVRAGGFAPAMLAGSLAIGLIFLWAAEADGVPAGLCAAALVAANHLWRVRDAVCLPDQIMAACYVGALYCLFADPWLESWWALAGMAGAAAAGIYVDGPIGFLPVAVLALYWIGAPAKYRPQWWRVVALLALAAVVAAVHSGTPPRDASLYLHSRLALLDPALLALFVASAPTFEREIRRRSAPGVLLLASLVVPAAVALASGRAAVSPVFCVAPMLAIPATALNPLCSGKASKWTLAVLIAAFLFKLAIPEENWGLFGAG